MAIKNVLFRSCTCLECQDTPSAPIIICVDASLVAEPLCPTRDDTFETWPYRFIYGLLATTCKGTCQHPFCYVLSYDDEQTTGYTLQTSDIKGVFCEDCLTQFIEDYAGGEVYLRTNEDQSLTLVSQHGCEYTFTPGSGDTFCLSPNEGNIAELDDSGCLFVPDTACISTDEGNLLTLGTDDCLFVPNPICISENEGNTATLDESGCIFVPESGGGGGSPWDLLIFGDGSDGDVTVHNGEEYFLPYPARPYHFNNLTIEVGGIFHPYGYTQNNLSGNSTDREYFPFFVKETLSNSGTITSDGIDGVGQTGGNSSGSGEALAVSGPGGADDSGVDGGNAEQAGHHTTRNLGQNGNGYMGGGLGGVGGNGGGASGGAGYAPVVPTDGYPFNIGRFLIDFFNFSMGQSFIADSIGGGSGGGSGGGGTNAGGAGGVGGGSGSGGGSLCFGAKNIINTASGIFSCKGGNGGDGAAGVGGNASGGGGGGGGGGGAIYGLHRSLTNDGVFDVSGGTGGAGGAKVGTGTVGTSGANGADGKISLANTLTGLFVTP